MDVEMKQRGDDAGRAASATRTYEDDLRREPGERHRRGAVRAASGDVGIGDARARFGGIDIPATLVGLLTALAVLVLASGLVGAAIGAVGYQTGLKGDDIAEISIASLVGGLVILFLSYVVGGWAAARIARYDGARNGIMTAVWSLVLAAALSGLAAWLGNEYDVLRNVELPQWFSRDALTAGAIASAAFGVLAMLAGGLTGGVWGERYHRRADAAIAATRTGGITAREEVRDAR